MKIQNAKVINYLHTQKQLEKKHPEVDFDYFYNEFILDQEGFFGCDSTLDVKNPFLDDTFQKGVVWKEKNIRKILDPRLPAELTKILWTRSLAAKKKQLHSLTPRQWANIYQDVVALQADLDELFQSKEPSATYLVKELITGCYASVVFTTLKIKDFKSLAKYHPHKTRYLWYFYW